MSNPRAGIPNKDHFVPPPRAHPRGHTLVWPAITRATNLITTVRDEGADSIGTILDRCDRQQLYSLVVVLAAMVPDDQSVQDLTAWVLDREPTQAAS